MDAVINYTLYVNNTRNLTNLTQNGTLSSFNISLLGDGNYTLNIEALDEAGNRRNSSFIIIFVDTAAPFQA